VRTDPDRMRKDDDALEYLISEQELVVEQCAVFMHPERMHWELDALTTTCKSDSVFA